MYIKNIENIKSKIEKEFLDAEIKMHNYSIIAVSKTIKKDNIEELLLSGYRIFGENKVQEVKEKWLELKKKYPDVLLHFIGHLQKNKVKYLPGIVDYIHTLDSIKLANEISKQIEKNNNWKPKIFIQVNIGEEEQKSGVKPSDLKFFIKDCEEIKHIKISGLMCIPPINEESSIHFAFLKKLADENNLKDLSMGMSGDYKKAALMGSTFIRIGTDIFGNRN